ncbi:MAG TPA: hypothetical protein VGG20_15405 [Thermoanaerobaculia bacterium]|jgi:hypothetical protein
MKATMATAEIGVPERLPFLESISWFDRDYRTLSPLDMLRRYEASWRWMGSLTDPSPEEKAFIRELIQRYSSSLDVENLW